MDKIENTTVEKPEGAVFSNSQKEYRDMLCHVRTIELKIERGIEKSGISKPDEFSSDESRQLWEAMYEAGAQNVHLNAWREALHEKEEMLIRWARPAMREECALTLYAEFCHPERADDFRQDLVNLAMTL